MGPGEATEFLGRLSVPGTASGVEVLLFPPAVTLGALSALLPEGEGGDGSVSFGAQNVYWEDQGAFTGETSLPMVQEAGATHVLIGHSERRHVFGETDDEVARKVAAVLRHGLVPVVCVGETLQERQGGRWEDVVLRQVDAAVQAILPTIADGSGQRFLFAYEPVWAIGTGETATPEDASTAHAAIRRRLAEGLGVPASSLQILYGGSVKPGNARELMSRQEVDGVLVGGASLDPTAFDQIIDAAVELGAGRG